MGFPYFNPPHIQKINTIEQGNFFVPTKGAEEEELSREMSARKAKTIKVLKICGLILGVVAFIVVGIFVLKDPTSLGI